MRASRCFAAGMSAALATHGAAQSFANGNFETGDLSGWTIVNTPNGVGAPGGTFSYDIDATGPLSPSFAAGFMVGQVTFTVGDQEGIEITQSLSLSAGIQYVVDFDWAAQRVLAVGNAEGGVFSVIVNGAIVEGIAAGEVGGTNPNPKVGHFRVSYVPAASGPVDVGIRITRPYVPPGDLTSYVDNIAITVGSISCYANCDASTTPPVLNVLDFNCFLNRFANGDTYANCDSSTTPPTLNMLDFACFLSRFAAGCS